MTDDNRMSFEEVNLKDPGQETSSWRSWLGWKSGSSNDDFAYLLAIAPTQDRIAAVHFSGKKMAFEFVKAFYKCHYVKVPSLFGPFLA